MDFYFYIEIMPFVPFENLPAIWNIILKGTLEFISSCDTLPIIETPKSGVEAFVNLLRAVPHIQEITGWDKNDLNNLDSGHLWAVEIHFLWKHDSIQWGWDFTNYLNALLDEKLKLFTDKILLDNPYCAFSIGTIVKRKDLQRTREDHLKIWKLIELAVQETLYYETFVSGFGVK